MNTSQVKKLISIVVPVLNEIGNLERVCARVEAVMMPLSSGYDFEILFMDNHSDDGTFDEISRLSMKKPYIRAIRFSKNIGYQLSILNGLKAAEGDAIVQLDADLEDPPELIPVFISEWEKEIKVVYGIRLTRVENRFRTASRKAFYRFLNKISTDQIPLDAGDFRLIDRSVVDQLRNLNDQRPYLRGLISSLGFSQLGVPYRREERLWGKSKFPYQKMKDLAIDGIVNHSDLPLRLATKIGIVVSASSFFLGFFYLIGKLVFKQEWADGFATTTILILVSLGLISLLLGIIGEYLFRIFSIVRGYPFVIVEREIKKSQERRQEDQRG